MTDSELTLRELVDLLNHPDYAWRVYGGQAKVQANSPLGQDLPVQTALISGRQLGLSAELVGTTGGRINTLFEPTKIIHPDGDPKHLRVYAIINNRRTIMLLLRR